MKKKQEKKSGTPILEEQGKKKFPAPPPNPQNVTSTVHNEQGPYVSGLGQQIKGFMLI